MHHYMINFYDKNMYIKGPVGYVAFEITTFYLTAMFI